MWRSFLYIRNSRFLGPSFVRSLLPTCVDDCRVSNARKLPNSIKLKTVVRKLSLYRMKNKLCISRDPYRYARLWGGVKILYTKALSRETLRTKNDKNTKYLLSYARKLMSRKMAEVFYFQCPKRPLLCYYRGFWHFSDFQILSDLGRSKSFLGSFFHSWRKHDLKTYITPPKPQILILTFFDLVTLDDLGLTQCDKSLRRVLRSIPNRIHVVPSALF